jgi:hypothetical protein
MEYRNFIALRSRSLNDDAKTLVKRYLEGISPLSSFDALTEFFCLEVVAWTQTVVGVAQMMALIEVCLFAHMLGVLCQCALTDM